MSQPLLLGLGLGLPLGGGLLLLDVRVHADEEVAQHHGAPRNPGILKRARRFAGDPGGTTCACAII